MWPSLSTANQIADWANIFLIGSLVVGVVSTVTIVWMSGVKETYWEADRRASEEKIAALTTQGDQLRKDTAEANARAAEANLSLVKLRTPRAQLMTPEALASIVEKIRLFAGTKFDVGHQFENREAWDFLWYLEPALSKAGWIQVDWLGGQRFQKDGWPGNHWYGIANVSDVSIEVHPASRPKLMPAAEALAEALRAVGIAVHNDNNNTSQNDDAIHFLVGTKQ